MHLIKLTLAATLTASTAIAGGLAPAIAEQPVIIVEQAPAASSGANIIVPLLLLGLLAAAASANGTSGDNGSAPAATPLADVQG